MNINQYFVGFVYFVYLITFLMQMMLSNLLVCKTMPNHLNISATSYVSNTFLHNPFLPPHNILSIKHCVLQVSSPDTLQSAIKMILKLKFSNSIVQFPSHLHPALSYSLNVSHESRNASSR